MYTPSYTYAPRLTPRERHSPGDASVTGRARQYSTEGGECEQTHPPPTKVVLEYSDSPSCRRHPNDSARK
ncbi:hypothetical protein EVAR_29_1 [Eumeta japonica]|uniref:Uncharacterized protein n=1 Tax=Eumeta variegata TaxID=151549 RepID=A0A4C1S7M6_EUMVA|nr:hypothetical protein EVAR_29_1 [Eumeta japonica]